MLVLHFNALRFVPRCATFSLLLFAALTPALAVTNSWINPSNGNWEDASSWSLGVRPDSTQDVVFTNAGFKALAIGANTAHNFPASMTVQSLTTGAPSNSFNVLLMNFAGFELPLQTGSLNVKANSAIYVLSSALKIQNATSISGSFIQGDFSVITFLDTFRLYDSSSLTPGSYYMTNGAFGGPRLEIAFGAKFVQYGGTNQTSRTEVLDTATYQLDGGIFGASSLSPLEDGVFIQNGGTNNAFIDVGGDFGPGHYVLNGGLMTGNMSIPLARGSGDVLQTGGTNAVGSLNIGNGTRFGGFGSYVLSNGVVNVGGTALHGFGTFTQWNGRHTPTNLAMGGIDLSQFGVAYAAYALHGGTVSANHLPMGIATFNQQGGSNVIAGNITIGPASQKSLYTLNGGFLSTSNLFLNGSKDSGFDHNGGTNVISTALCITDVGQNFHGYNLTGGVLIVNNISISNGAAFHHISGTINHSGLLTLAGGRWDARPAEQLLGPLLLTGQSTNSVITFPDGASILRIANSSVQPWSPSTTLFVSNWHGSATGGGATQLYFGSNANGLSAQQLALIKFSLPTGVFPAKILATGEVVPQAQFLNFTRSGNTLTLTWDPGFILQSSTNIAGPYSDVPGATSPHIVSSPPNRFFRLRQ